MTRKNTVNVNQIKLFQDIKPSFKSFLGAIIYRKVIYSKKKNDEIEIKIITTLLNSKVIKTKAVAIHK